MKQLNVIVMHGDLADVPFIEKTLGVKFSVQNNGRANGEPNPTALVYFAFPLPDAQISVQLYIQNDRADQLKAKAIARMHISVPSECVPISLSSIEGVFGSDFTRDTIVHPTKTVGLGKQFETPTKNGSRLSLGVLFSENNKLIHTVTISQRP